MNATPSPQTTSETRAAWRVLTLSTFAFTLLFAVWLMLGVLGIKLKSEPSLLLGGAAASLDKADIASLIESRFEWLLAVSILSGALLRLHFGVWSDAYGGRNMMMLLLLACALPTAGLSYARNYLELLVCAALFGLAGNAFSVGVAWNSAWFSSARKGAALGVFGAGNVGASGTKLLLLFFPGVLSLVPAAGLAGGWIPGGWRIIPLLYAALLVATAAAIYFICPAVDPKPGKGRSFKSLMQPLREVRVWRFSFYYVLVFGAYVALSAWLPSYYVNTFGVDLHGASLLTAIFIFPASLLRPLGGWLSDLYGPRKVTYVVFVWMTLATIPLCLPASMLPQTATTFTANLFLVAVAMGVGKGSVFKYIPNYFPKDVGAVGGLVGLLGALGGFLLPKAFGWLGRSSGFPQAAFFILLAISLTCLLWLHWVIRSMAVASRSESENNELAPEIAPTL